MEAAMAHLRLRWRAASAVGVLGLASAALLTLGSAPAGATTVTDETTFRAAWINAAETQIDLAADITLTCGGGGVSVRNSTTAVSLDGHGHTIRQTCANNGVLRQTSTGAVTFANVTITGGTITGAGGGGFLSNGGALTVTNSIITNNTTDSTGGGVVANVVTVTGSTISNNSAAGGGGIIATGALTITNSTVSGNTATAGGGGGVNNGAALTVTNSTFANNASTSSGGGINDNGNALLTVMNSTFVNNSAGTGAGGGAIAGTGAVIVTNSTLSGNSAAGATGHGAGISTSGDLTMVYATVVDNSAAQAANVNLGTTGNLHSFGSVIALARGGGPNCGFLAGTTSNGFNFSDDASCGLAAATDKQNAGDPGLGALADNGGTTPTRLPLSGSLLVDAIPNGSCQADGASGITTDQRGLPRPEVTAGLCDIGAVEVQPTPPPTPPGPTPAAPVQAVVRFTG
jgi:hypothetical protein